MGNPIFWFSHGFASPLSVHPRLVSAFSMGQPANLTPRRQGPKAQRFLGLASLLLCALALNFPCLQTVVFRSFSRFSAESSHFPTISSFFAGGRALQNAKCSLQTAQCIEQNAQCTEQIVQCSLQNPFCIQQNAQCTEQNVKCSLQTAQCIEQNAQCTEQFAQCSLQKAFCIGQNAFCKPQTAPGCGQIAPSSPADAPEVGQMAEKNESFAPGNPVYAPLAFPNGQKRDFFYRKPIFI